MYAKTFVMITLLSGVSVFIPNAQADETRDYYISLVMSNPGVCEKYKLEQNKCDCAISYAYDTLPDDLKGYVMLLYDLESTYPDKPMYQLENILRKEYNFTYDDTRRFRNTIKQASRRVNEVCSEPQEEPAPETDSADTPPK